MPLIQITAPTVEPLSLAEAKQHLRALFTDTSEDTLITGLIAAARAACEMRCQRQIIASRWQLVMDAFPGPSLMGVPAGVPFSLPGHAIIIPRGAVLQVVSIQYQGMDGAWNTLATTEYIADTSGDPCRITPQFGKIWPVTLPQIGAVKITFDCGHAAPITAVDTAGDSITAPAWKTLVATDTLRVSKRDSAALGDGVLPAPLAAYTDYYVQSVVSAGVYKLAATSGGVAIDITSAGGGDKFIGEIPPALTAWIKLTVAALYENREAVAVDTRIATVELPSDFLDGLLDPFRLRFF